MLCSIRLEPLISRSQNWDLHKNQDAPTPELATPIFRYLPPPVQPAQTPAGRHRCQILGPYS